MIDNYLQSIDLQFRYYKQLAERTFAQVSDEKLFWRPTPESNSIAVIVNHLSGNMLSRWTDFLESDGEKAWRDRDQEFENVLENKHKMLEAWEQGWNCLFQALTSIDTNQFERTIYIRNMGHTVTEAINRQLAHYSYHVGQIVYIGRMAQGETWKSLSIPKGDSKSYNAKKFRNTKRLEHFTKEFLEEEGQPPASDVS